MKSALARELRENSAYLRDSGFHASARLMDIAASEIDQLSGGLPNLNVAKQKTSD